MLVSSLVLLGFGCLTGVTTVLFGFGGGFIIVPVVFAVVSAATGADAMHTAVATSTAVMIVNASTATIAQARSGRLRKEHLHPLLEFIALGAVLGAVAANWAPESVLHVLFIAYLAVTIVDSLARRGFLDNSRDAEGARPLGKVASTAGGVGIGAVASFLGVGGSVLTVPLLRRRGLPMADAAAMANPLSIPVAVAGTAVYALATPTATYPGQIGHVNFVVGAILLCGSLPTIALTKRLVGKIPDRVHAIAYVALLVVVMITMIVTALT
ncbi:sulfite exporter TauE/SafE family protein [Saccharopolyspora sp. WRP15-2]|uniref:Probable membrane transporter protein n=1 Tax=Saccharopolyspora oryzae TaxID=2997343 RepID=A0ABT4V9B1_9PSEU|nr:sulfite exporter TauE/SafE family protein [Saccharopolyspora oryzae]MDA3629882.1 sulfite exporter TauE/SafE family protein [Saccharopolyspora oryzae]